MWSCCHLPYDGVGCSRGPHVFSESTPEELHIRHPFSWTRSSNNSEGLDTALDVVAMDCEMIYSTGGVRVARVSVVDGSGKEIFDEHVRMDDGVEVMSVAFCLLLYSPPSPRSPFVNIVCLSEISIPGFQVS